MTRLCAATLVALVIAAAALPGGAAPPAPADEFTAKIRPLLARHCASCHGAKDPEADLDLTAFATLADVRKAPRVWQKVGEQLDGGQMPPRDAAQPSAQERDALKTWVHAHLKGEAQAHAGDPGRVPLRRLSHSEYAYTVRDLTGVASLDPAKEFPVDGAAGEGFTNAGEALAMSPALLSKYLDAGKQVAAHAVLLPDGLRFSPHAGRPDWTREALDKIRAAYAKYAAPGGSKVAVDGLVWDGKEGGRLPVERYVAAALEERKALESGAKTPAAVAAGRGLSGKYLGLVWAMLQGEGESPLFDDLRRSWRTATPADAARITADIARWQGALWKFNRVGHIGAVGGPKAWLEPVDPLVSRQELRAKLPPPAAGGAVTLHLAAGGAGEAVWGRPRFSAPGKPDVLLRDIRGVSTGREMARSRAFNATTGHLGAADEALVAAGGADVAALAKKHGLDAEILAAWLDILGIGAGGPATVTGHFTDKLTNVGGHAFVAGWGSPETPNMLANASDRTVRVPGELRGRGVVVHPSPKLAAAVGWQSPAAGAAKVTASVRHAHPVCGNGVAWALEVRRGGGRQRLAEGVAFLGQAGAVNLDAVPVAPGDLVSIVVGARGADHACDLTAVELTVSVGGKSWDLAKDVAANVTASNPHGVWHFYSEPAGGPAAAFTPPPGSLLAKWRAAPTSAERAALAKQVHALLTTAGDVAAPDAACRRELASLGGPLFGRSTLVADAAGAGPAWGVDPARSSLAGDLVVRAPEVVEVRVPADLVAGCEFVAGAALALGSEGPAQLRIATTKPTPGAALEPGVPVLAAGAARGRLERGFRAFRAMFPTAVCYARVVPIDEGVTLTLYHREDARLAELLLTDAEAKDLDRLWAELHYISHSALAQVDAFKQLMEYATQDGDPRAFEPLRQPTLAAAAAFRKQLVDTEPKHLDAVLEFAGRAYRRPLTDAEGRELRGLYAKLRAQGLPHDDALRLTLARVLVAPAFLYKLERATPGAAAAPVSDYELASRLSYFLWSSAPDVELLALAAAGTLRDPDALAAQAKRMTRDPRVRRLAVEFGCQWLHVRGFDRMNEKSERHFPEFAGLKGAMYEESVLVFTDFFQADRPVLDLLEGDATFLNDALAKHYGVPGVSGPAWRRVEGVKQHGRGGILALGTTLATQSGASRTSPILRGNWVSEVLLGEKLPRPPKNVPQLADDEAQAGALTVRQQVERHTKDPACATCHARIDAYGFALEAFDPVGRRRERDLAGRPVDVSAKTLDGAEFAGLDGLRGYLATARRAAFERQFCKKLLGYALGRAAQLSDEPLLDAMRAALAKNGGRVSAALEAVVRSRQFREIRGAGFAEE